VQVRESTRVLRFAQKGYYSGPTVVLTLPPLQSILLLFLFFYTAAFGRHLEEAWLKPSKKKGLHDVSLFASPLQ
jgi:hypothetical protein